MKSFKGQPTTLTFLPTAQQSNKNVTLRDACEASRNKNVHPCQARTGHVFIA